MLSLFKKVFVTALVFPVGLIVNGFAYDRPDHYTDTDPLLSGPRGPRHSSKLSPDAHHLKDLTPESESRNFRTEIDNLATAFENFESLSLTDQEELLNEWKDRITAYGLIVSINQAGFVATFYISSETIQKLMEINRLYSRQKKQPCAIL